MLPVYRVPHAVNSLWFKWILWHALGFFIVGVSLFSLTEAVVVSVIVLFGIQGYLLWENISRCSHWVVVSIIGLAIGSLVCFLISTTLLKSVVDLSTLNQNNTVISIIFPIIVALTLSISQWIMLHKYSKITVLSWVNIHILIIMISCGIMIIFSWIFPDSLYRSKVLWMKTIHPFFMAIGGISYSVLLGLALKPGLLYPSKPLSTENH